LANQPGGPDWAVFLPFGSLFTLGSLMQISAIAQFFRLLFYHRKSYAKMLTKMRWATFWAIL
jgi:hypothetical protein